MVQIIIDLEENENQKIEDFQKRYKIVNNISLNKGRTIRKILDKISNEELEKIINT